MADFDSAGSPEVVAASWALTAIGLELFAASVIRHAHTGAPLTQEVLQGMRRDILFEVQDFGMQGTPMQEEAKALRQALQQVEQLIDSAIGKARGRQHG